MWRTVAAVALLAILFTGAIIWVTNRMPYCTPPCI
jgi:hypothetical protein